MKKCPSEAEIVALGSGTLPEKVAAKIASHIAACPKCRRMGRQYGLIERLLRYVKPTAAGQYEFSPPVLSRDAVERLKANTAAEWEQRTEWRRQLKSAVHEIWMKLLGNAPGAGQTTAPLFGYAATRRARGLKKITAKEARRFEELKADVTDIITALLDQSTALEERAAWAASLKAALEQMMTAPEEPPAARSRKRN